MKKEAKNILILGGSGALGQALFTHLKKSGYAVTLTYYKNKPTWANVNESIYFNANSKEQDAELTEKLRAVSWVLNLLPISVYVRDEHCTLEGILPIIKMASSGEFRYANVLPASVRDQSALKGKSTLEDKVDFAKLELVSDLTARAALAGGLTVFHSPVLSSSSNLFKQLGVLTRLKITPIIGSGLSKITPIHTFDFCCAISDMIAANLEYTKPLILKGGEPHTVRYLLILASKGGELGAPWFLQLSKNFFMKHKKHIDKVTGKAFAPEILIYLATDWNEVLKGKSLTSLTKTEVLSLDARLKREKTEKSGTK